MPNQKRILVNGTLAAGVSRDEFIDWVHQHIVSPDAWDLVQKRILLDLMFKVGESAGLVAFMDAETEGEALGLLHELPIASEGIIEFTVEKVSPVASFD
jgi:hypothetical protein